MKDEDLHAELKRKKALLRLKQQQEHHRAELAKLKMYKAKLKELERTQQKPEKIEKSKQEHRVMREAREKEKQRIRD